MSDILWIAWEKQRRSIELSKALEAKLFLILSKNKGWLRYIESIIKTSLIILKEKPRYLIVQNPSIVLAFLACMLKPLLNFYLIVDRHSNFLLWKKKYNIIDKLFFVISDTTFVKADLTIITNSNLKRLVDSKGGKGFVLPDKLPNLNSIDCTSKSLSYIVTYICTYANDEPYMEVIRAASLIDDKIKIWSASYFFQILLRVSRNPRCVFILES